MSIHIELTPDLEADLAAQAAKSGIALSDYIRTVLLHHVAPAEIRPLTLTPAERARAFEEWVREFPYRRTKPLPDEAIQRESFYRPDDE
ncbi:MAG: hypothetical protein LAP87_03950 [Acidobacteriia bacterium]|nr:hypothetical protein [Terriglobia bacterium]